MSRASSPVVVEAAPITPIAATAITATENAMHRVARALVAALASVRTYLCLPGALHMKRFRSRLMGKRDIGGNSPDGSPTTAELL
jgi:hypothetical protein